MFCCLGQICTTNENDILFCPWTTLDLGSNTILPICLGSANYSAV